MTRFSEYVKEDRLVDVNATRLQPRVYNFALGACVLWGLVVNAVMCYFLGDVVSTWNPVLFIIGYFASGLFGIHLSKSSDKAWVSFIGYNFVVVPIGLVLSTVVAEYASADKMYIVYQAIVYTAIITAVMIALSIAFPNFFSKLGTLLAACLFGLLIAMLIAALFMPQAWTAISWIASVIFSLCIGYEYWEAQHMEKTLDNAVDCSVGIYLDIVNLFIHILSLLGSNSSNKD